MRERDKWDILMKASKTKYLMHNALAEQVTIGGKMIKNERQDCQNL